MTIAKPFTFMLGCALVAGIGSVAMAAQTNATPAESRSRAVGSVPNPGNSVPQTRAEHLVVVYGFRVIRTPYDLRVQGMRQGYAALATNEACRTQSCAFVTLKRDGKWHSTTVLAGDPKALQEMSSEIESPDSTFVIVHPPGDRLQPPYIQ